VIPYISIDAQRSSEIYVDIVFHGSLDIPRDPRRSPEISRDSPETDWRSLEISGDPQRSPEIRFPGIPEDPR